MKILLATDGSEYALTAIEKCCRLMSLNENSELKIISVADTTKPVGTEPFGVGSDYYSTLNKELHQTSEKYVREAETLVRDKVGNDIKIHTEIIDGSPKAAIVGAAEDWQTDLVVVGSHGYGFFERMLIGSVSDAVLHHAPCSVLVVKQDEENKSN